MNPKIRLFSLLAPLLALCGLLLFETAALAGVKEGNEAYKAGKYLEALSQWMPEAEVGNRSAQYNLGLMYLRGSGVDKDEATALEWFEKSAKQNYTQAQYRAGLLRSQIKGELRSQRQGVIWLHEAAKRGHAGAQYQLARRYEKGVGVKKNLVRGLYWVILSEARTEGKQKSSVVELHERLVADMSEEQVAEATDLATKAEAKLKKAKSEKNG